MKVKKIIEKAETMNHAKRWEYMIGLGRESTNNPILAQALRELSLSEIHYERLLSLMSICGSFDEEIIIRLAQDASTVGMYEAIKLAAKHLSLDKLIEIAPRLSKGKRSGLIRALCKAERTDVIEAIYATAENSERTGILLNTSESFFEENITQEMTNGFTNSHLRLMAKRFPKKTMNEMDKLLAGTGALPWLTQTAASAVIFSFLNSNPELGISLLKKVTGRMHTGHLPISKYACLFPNEITKLLLSQPKPAIGNLPPSVLTKLDAKTLYALIEKNVNVHTYFKELSPKQRITIYNAVGESLRQDSGAMSLFILKALPNPAREQEAIHAFGLKSLAARPGERLPYLSVLPFEQALTLAGPYLNQPEGELRAAAVSAVIMTGRYYPSSLGDILDFCVKREREQDPVRNAMVTALASLPPSRWTVAHLPKIRHIVKAALSARDASYQTMQFAAKWLLKIMPIHMDFVVAELPDLVAKMGGFYVYDANIELSNAEMARLDECLLPILETWVKRSQHNVVISVAHFFAKRINATNKQLATKGKRLGIVKLLIEMTDDKRNIASRGIEALTYMKIRHEVAALVPRLLKQDTSWILSPAVSAYLHRHRQDLLTPFLHAQKYKGRFKSGNTSMVLNFDNGFMRWSAEQQQTYANALKDIINSEKRNAWEVAHNINRLSLMPSVIYADTLEALARPGGEGGNPVAEKALEALGRADAGRGVPHIISVLGERQLANVAIYALRRAVCQMPASKALALLSGALENPVNLQRVTVLKEIIRLAGEFDGADAYAFLGKFLSADNLHPDVYIALLRALWKHLHRDEIWAYFTAVVESGNYAAARSTIRIPQEGLNSAGRERLCKHMTMLMKHENAQIRMETLQALDTMPLTYMDKTMFNALAELLDNADKNVCAYAGRIIIRNYVSNNSNEIVDAFANIIRPPAFASCAKAFHCETFADLLDRQNCVRMLISALIGQRRLPTQAMTLAIQCLPTSEIVEVAEKLADAKLLHPYAVEISLNWNTPINIYPQHEVDILEENLRLSSRPELRRQGLSLLLSTADKYGWTENRRENLIAYQADMELWIAEPAGMVEPPERPCSVREFL